MRLKAIWLYWLGGADCKFLFKTNVINKPLKCVCKRLLKFKDKSWLQDFTSVIFGP